MRREYHKIVRDRIPEIIEKNGQRAVLRRLGTEETVSGLEQKLSEEIGEYLEAPSLEEMADILEVMHGILYHKNIDWEELERVRLEKKSARGGFGQGYWLEATEDDE